MKYQALLQFLRVLIYLKRFFWWIGARFYFVLDKLWRFVVYTRYKSSFFLRKRGVGSVREFILKRSFLQIIFLVILFFIALPHTKLYAEKGFAPPGQNTVAYLLIGGEPDGYEEEVALSSASYFQLPTPSWRDTVLHPEFFTAYQPPALYKDELVSVVAEGTAVFKPIIMPGTNAVFTRNEVVNYTVEPGDSLGTIAADFGVNVATILWENNLSAKSIIRPGNILKIPPISGVMHTVKKGDSLSKIASLYEGKTEEIVRFNNLKSDGTDLKVGIRIMVPGGIKPQQQAIARIPRTDSVATRVAVPPASSRAPSGAGYVWPSGAHTITQYFGLRHPALDIAGPYGTPTYASKSGVVETAGCGWNYGYGCYIIINHGGGVKTLYGHHSKLLVSPGDFVETGQTIALMGNTGRVYGKTGIHVHFEVIVNGKRVNPLGYVK